MTAPDAQNATGSRVRVLLAITGASAGVTAYQLTLMQLFSFVQWYHFAYMMVSLALLGFGASGTVLTFLWRPFRRHASPVIRCGLLLAALAMPGVLALIHQPWLRFDLYLIFVDNTQIGRFVAAVFLMLLPFFFGALAIGGILTTRAEEAPRYYFADLLGSAAGGLGGIALSAAFFPGEGAAVCGLAMLAAAVVYGSRSSRTVRHAPPLAVFAVLAALFAASPDWEPSQFKPLGRVLAMPRAELAAKSPGVRGVLHRVRAPTLHTAPGLSLNYGGEIPPGDTVFVNGTKYGSLQSLTGEGPIWEQATTEALAYTLHPSPGSALLLGTNGLSALRLAKAENTETVRAVEPHPQVARWIREALPADNGAWRIRTLAPRVALERTGGGIDLIRYPVIGGFHGGVGLGALGAEFLLTRESFATAIEKLGDDGVLVVPCWLDFPERKPLRLLTTLLAGARETGIAAPEEHLAIIRGWGAMGFLFQKKALASEEENALLAACDKWNFDPLWLAGRKDLARERHNELESKTLFRMTDAILRGEHDRVAEYPFAIGAATDNRPFFSQFLRPRSLGTVRDVFGGPSVPFFELGSFLLLVTIAVLFVFATVLILLPLPFHRLRSPGRTPTVLYFAALGLGFLFVEIICMQIFDLIWGSPILAAGGTIAGMLFFSGTGALASRRIDAKGPFVPVLAVGVVVLLALAAGLLLPLSREVATLAPVWRYAFGTGVLAVLGFPLGFFFPTGLRLLREHRPDHLPWAWGVNGAFSVISSPLALLACVLWGFTTALALAAACYAVAAATLPRLRKAPLATRR